MKKLLLMSLFAMALSISNAQITLDGSLPSTDDYASPFLFSKLSVGEKYAMMNQDNGELKLYNLNYSVFKTIAFPTIALQPNERIGFNLINVSDKLFDSNNKIECLVDFNIHNSSNFTNRSFVYVYDEDGTVVFSKDSATLGYVAIGGNDVVVQGIINTTNGAKMVIKNNKNADKSIQFYSLPGTLMSTNTNQKIDKAGMLSYPMPNPASDMTKIEFELPEGERMGEILVYNQQGILMKSYIVDDTFGFLMLNSSDLSAGTYVYQMKAENRLSESQKMMVIK
ncbi:MAG: T9SS type A sorting domain-containing protein [Cytophagaceae bacterium]